MKTKNLLGFAVKFSPRYFLHPQRFLNDIPIVIFYDNVTEVLTDIHSKTFAEIPSESLADSSQWDSHGIIILHKFFVRV